MLIMKMKSTSLFSHCQKIVRENASWLAGVRALFVATAIMMGLVSFGQPNMYKTVVGTSSTANLLNTNSRKSQQLYLPGDLTGAANGNISKVYFRWAANTTGNYTNFSIKLGQTTATAFSPNGSNYDFFTGLTTVFSAATYTIVVGAAAGDFVELPISVPFAYDASKTLIVEIAYQTVSSTSPNARSSTGPAAPNQRAIYHSTFYQSTVSNNAGTVWPDMGFQVDPFMMLDAAITNISMPTAVTTIGSQDIQVVINNNGTQILNSAQITWNVNGVNQAPFSWSGSLAPGASSGPVTIGTYNFSVLGKYSIVTAVQMPNGAADQLPENDQFSIEVKACGPLSGNYTINSSQPTLANNFNSFKDAVDFLSSCGVNDDVTIEALQGSGPFAGQTIIPFIPGASAANLVTFKGNGEVLTHDNTAVSEISGRSTLILDSAQFVVIDSFTINATATTGWGIHLTKGSNNITVKNSSINVSTTSSTSGNTAGIVASGSYTSYTTAANGLNNITIQNNNITGGYIGVVFAGPTQANNAIIQNRVAEFYASAIQVAANQNITIASNEVYRHTRTTSTTVNAINITGATVSSNIYGNRIFGLFDAQPTASSTANCITINDLTPASAAEANKVYNNLVYDIKSSGNIVGILQTASPYTRIYHNTIVLDHVTATGTSTTRGYQQTTNATGIEFKNNLVYISRSTTGKKHAIALVTSGTTVESNNNVFYVTGTAAHIGLQGSTDRTTLTDWQTNASQDLNSVEADPIFLNPATADFTPSNSLVANKGANVGVTTDINGDARTLAAPDPGAIEWTAAGLDAAISWVSPALPTTTGLKTIVVNIANTQSVTITSVSLKYTDGTTTVTQNFTGLNLTAGSNIDLSFTTQYQLDFARLFTVEILSVNGITDGESSNNVVNIYLCVALSGNYTINKGMPTNLDPAVKNFSSFADMASALGCGISGNVTVEVAVNSGPYDEQVTINSINGAGPGAVFTLKGNGNRLQFAVDNATRHLIRLTDASYIVIDSLMVGTTSPTTTGFMGIHIFNSANNITIRNCTADMTGITSTLAGGIVCSGSASSILTQGNFNNITLMNNATMGGGYGLAFYGTANTNIQFTGNDIRDYSSNGIYTRGTDGIVVSNNTITKNAGSSGTNAIQLAQSDNNNGRVFNNIITHEQTAVATSRGIYIFGGSGHRVYNNVIRDIKAETGTAYSAIAIRGATEVYFNTIVLDHANNSAAALSGIIEESANTGSVVKNNIFVITQTSTAARTAIAINSTSVINTSVISNNNVFWLQGGANVASRGTSNYITLADWTLASTQDSLSAEEDPMFVSTTLAKPTNANINSLATPIAWITTDILNQTRSANPDPGAYEFTLPPCNASPTPGTTTSTAVQICSGQYFTLDLSGNSTGDLQTYQWQYSLNGVDNWIDLGSPSSVTKLVTTQTISRYYRSAVVCNNGTPVYSTPLLVQNPSPFSGTITINDGVATGGSNYASFLEAIEMLKCATINGPVNINVVSGSGPYTEQVIIPQIQGMSAANPIIINGNSTTITFLSTVTSQRGLIKLDGADFVTIDNLNLEVQGSTASEFGYGVHILNDADNNTISNCFINVNTTSTGTNWAGIVINGAANAAPTTTGSSLCDSNVIAGNTIVGGHTGISVTANGATSQIHGNKAINNTVRDFYTNGISINGNVNAVIEGNEFSRPNRTTVTDFRGVNMDGISLGTLVTRNVIHDPFVANQASTAAAVGIRIASADAAAGNENVVSNNVVYNFVGGTGTQNGLLINNSDHIKVYHNTFSIDDALASCNCAARAIYVQNTNVQGLDIRNNILTVSRGGTGEKQVIVFEPTSVASYTINNNIYYTDPATPGTVQLIKVGTTSYLNLADWQTTGKDANSYFADPGYFNAPGGNLTPTASSLDEKGTPVGVLVDVLNIARSTVTPDIGAYEFGVTVPVTFAAFTGEHIDGVNRLSWNTLVEQQNLGFTVERAIDPNNFKPISFVPSKATGGNSSELLTYIFIDKQPWQGINYYRLRQQDKDGKLCYSGIIAINSNYATFRIGALYPNPASDKVGMKVTLEEAMRFSIEIIDLSGRMQLSKQVALQAGSSEIELNISKLAKGNYFLRVVNNEGRVLFQGKFVK